MMRPRRDQNEPAVIDAYEAAGCRVVQLQAPGTRGKGTPDLLVRTPRRRLLLAEVKVPGKDLDPDQVAWHAAWAGVPLFVVHDEAEARATIAKVDAEP